MYLVQDIDLEQAMSKACDIISKILLVKTEEDEFNMLKEFYEIVLKEIKYPDINERIIDLLARDNVYNDEKFSFFNDVEPELQRLKKKYI